MKQRIQEYNTKIINEKENTNVYNINASRFNLDKQTNKVLNKTLRKKKQNEKKAFLFYV